MMGFHDDGGRAKWCIFLLQPHHSRTAGSWYRKEEEKARVQEVIVIFDFVLVNENSARCIIVRGGSMLQFCIDVKNHNDNVVPMLL